ncbi:hypothetical protein [Streptomyces sp. NA02536]|uniref:hypothetical protein n=1 Tax=Streptomyces sp. NA02536 TaxID=2742133 RepID=UPI0020CB470F|nr:hypothetical protein [Streptomyces sp. NA02536]
MHDDTEDDETAPVEATAAPGADPDVYLDVPVLKVDEIDLDVENLRAHVSLQTEVLDLLRLNVGADVSLGRVHLGISGVEAQAQLKVRLDNVAMIINRVLTTLDRNPELLRDLTRGIGSAVQDVGGGAGQAVGELGTGAGRAVEDVGQGAGRAVEDVGEGARRAVEDVGEGAGRAVEGVGQGAGAAVDEVGRGARSVAEDVGQGAGTAVEEVGGDVGRVVEDAGGEVSRTASGVADQEVADTTRTVKGTAGARRARPAAGEQESGAARSQGGPRKRRVRTEDGKLPPRPPRRRAAGERDEPP